MNHPTHPLPLGVRETEQRSPYRYYPHPPTVGAGPTNNRAIILTPLPRGL